MKVLFINTVHGKGSTGRIISDIGHMIEKKGGEYKVAYGRGTPYDIEHSYFIGNRINTYFHALLSRITDKAGFYSVLSTKRLIKFIQMYNPDIIHLHNLHGYYINIRILFTFLKEKFKGKIVWTLHDCWAFTGHCVHYSFAKCEKWKTGCFKCPEKSRYPASYVLDNSYWNYKKKKELFSNVPNLIIVTPSVWLHNQVKKSFLGTYSVVVINNGIDLSIFRLLDKRVKSEKKVIINVVDGMDSRKGFNDIISLRNILPSDYIIKVVGVSVPKNFKKEGIIFEQRTDSLEKLVEYYNEAECLINPTYEDTFPTINIEALACGLPVITYNAGGSPEAIDEGCGAVLSTGDIRGMYKAIIEHVGDSDKCIQKSFSYDKNLKYNEYLRLYTNLMCGEEMNEQ